MKDIYKIETRPVALAANMVVGERYRITLLTEGLLRLEYSEDGIFEDRATQMVCFRDFPETPYHLIRTKDGIEIHTSRIQLIYNEKEFSRHGLSIQVKGNISAFHSIWHYGEEIHDLGGTARTLDDVNGATTLDRGVTSRFGYSVIDDSRSQVLLPDGWIEPRKKGIQDLYFFGYGHDYKQALADFYRLCGKTPMLPRYALGNWWSRYYKYTEKSYLDLMERFDRENMPFTVAVIDMDWHLVDIDPAYGSGWTGYTWNKDFFPDPAGFLKKLHDRGMKTTLNVHPADGVQPHEEMYEEIAAAMGVDSAKKDPVNCDLANPDFVEAYFKYLHYPREKEGVDFWWIDWQQGTNSRVEGLDPLWILNHFHFLDSRKDGKRPMTFSRYAGPGSHRYPVGFSGDTHVTWESLQFQPYFTATASNIGFGWWSHDIGGHMKGYKDDEMTARWTQLGIYSPIMRLHSSNSEFNGKEPWRYKKETEVVMGEALRERHRMLPYLYTMNYRSYRDNLPIVLPMYYEYPDRPEAYNVPNQYYFGSEMIVAPITSKRVPKLNVAKETVWLPEGTWYDLYTGMIYQGNRVLDMYRKLDCIPVLAKAGAILPFTDEISGVQAGRNPESLRIKVFAGADGRFELYEDDNETCGYEKGEAAVTAMEYTEQDGAVFTIHPVNGERKLAPSVRSYTIELTGYREEAIGHIRISRAGQETKAELRYDAHKQAVILELQPISAEEELKIFIEGDYAVKTNQTKERCFAFLNQAEIDFYLKDEIYQMIKENENTAILLTKLHAAHIDENLFGALAEIVTADGCM